MLPANPINDQLNVLPAAVIEDRDVSPVLPSGCAFPYVSNLILSQLASPYLGAFSDKLGPFVRPMRGPSRHKFRMLPVPVVVSTEAFFRMRVHPIPAAVSRPSLTGSVQEIIGIGPKKEVIWVDAVWVVARMAYKKLQWVRALVDKMRYPGGYAELSLVIESSVSATPSLASPRPAFFCGAFGEPLFKSIYIFTGWHGEGNEFAHLDSSLLPLKGVVYA